MENNNTTSQFELNILDVINKVYQIDNYCLRQVFLLLTRNFFSDSNNFAPAGMNLPESYKQYTYSDKIVDPLSTSLPTIDIQLSYNNPDSPSKIDYLPTSKPLSIFIDVGDTTFGSNNSLNLFVRNFNNQGEEQSKIATTRITISHFATTYDDCARLSQLSASFYLSFKDMIRDKLSALLFDVKALTAPKYSEQNAPVTAKKVYRSDLIMDLSYESNWRINTEGVKIRKFNIKLLASN